MQSITLVRPDDWHLIWPELAEDPEPWMRYGDRWESISEFAGDAGKLQCACGDGFTVLRLGGGEE